MLVKELYELVKSGKHPIVKFNEKTHEFIEESLDPQMMGKIIGVTQEYEDSYRFRLDMNGFEAHNQSVAQQDWRDKEGVPCLTWFEVGRYPADGIEAVYLPVDAKAPLEIVEEDSLFGEYISEKSDKSYVEWLEEMVNRCRKKNGNKPE
ncbi:hypothetical protein CVD28_00385 [Bacillus sp. M6-12]|uniref:hypothetical protein n=1 Tax=Bacillus sp. M6-12 TaxID=2054166 RepID=UPI000C76C4EC|nr:hypothetical protein [Bacillus sp. M6-12]PLS18892.1 hypothetical protein CVD28_00385 [Bacillus sp. M6-12]